MDELTRQCRTALRRLARAPLFTAVAVITLAVGIGANAAIFSVVDSVLIKPLPYDRPDELVTLSHTAPRIGVPDAAQSQATYFTYRSDATTLQDIGIWSPLAVSVTGQGEPERVDALLVTDATLPMLGATTVVGRMLDRTDDSPGSPRTVVLAFGYWQRRFGGDRSVIGRTLQIGGQPTEIVGVLRRGFRVPELDPALYLPARFDPTSAQMGNFSYPAIGRLRPGVTIETAQADLARLLPVAIDRYPGPVTRAQIEDAGLTPSVVPLKNQIVGDVSTVLWVLVGTVGLVLLLACANVANLFLVQAEMRHREVAMRMALGAGRRSVATGFLIESLALAAVGGIVGLGLAYGGIRLLGAVGPESLPRLHEVGVDVRVLAFTAAVSIAAAALFGSFPVFRYGSADLHMSLKQGGRTAGGRERIGVRNGLVVLQVSLALVLLIGSGLMVRSVQSLRRIDPGFSQPERVLRFRLFVPPAEIPDNEAVVRLEIEILDRLRAVPGVIAVGGSAAFGLGAGETNANPVVVDGRPIDPGTMPPVRDFRFTAPGYHETLGTRLLAGRFLTWADVDARARVVVVNEAMARAEWGEPAAAIGQRVRDLLGTVWYEVVGVSGSVLYAGVTQPAPTVVYWPMVLERFWDEEPWVVRSLDYLVRTDRDPRLMLTQVRDAVWSVNASLPLANVERVDEALSRSMARPAFAMVMLSIAAIVALVLGLVGIYGVISYVVSQRTREIGVRIALGAEPAVVRRMVVGQAFRVIAVGVVVGLAASAGLTRLMAGMLHGVRPVDGVTYGLVTVAITVVALAASYVPARRAARVDPVAALRAEG